MLCCEYGCRNTIFIAELKRNPAKIRNYPRSCKSCDAQCVVTFLKNQATVPVLPGWEGSESGKVRIPAVSHNKSLHAFG